ncbi:hypothetical protein Tsubulata_025514 [Turnera subulata]|uniref:DUF4283 domain-containing protein n=1 Tax=Turnera subulata TaxID=218843 RepID=A0A9Q0F607_9ROSI|nr:hypothetical protein Tsubulata_025514 [Turnera subulata]
MSRFLQQKHDWIPLWFVSFEPWKNGDRAINRRCWIKVRGLPLNTWSQETFEIIGAIFGRLIRVHPETDQRKNLGAARIEILTTIGGVIMRTVEMKVLGQAYQLDVVEGGGIGDDVESSLSSKAVGMHQFEEEESGKMSPADGARSPTRGRGDNQEENMEVAGDPFNLMPIISGRVVRGKSCAVIEVSGRERAVDEPIITAHD